MATIVSLHAAAVDIPLLTGGTITRLVEAGHRVVVVTLTGDAPTPVTDEFGVARAETLGYEFVPGGASTVPDTALAELATLMADEDDIQLVIGYNEHGLGAEPTHLRVHEIAKEFAAARGIALVEAALVRELLTKAHGLAKMLGKNPPITNEDLDKLPTKSSVDFRISPLTHVPKKWDAISELARGTDDIGRILARVMQLPRIMISPMFKTEYFVTANREGVPEFFSSL